MDFEELLLESLRTLTLNKVRTGLAMLGVIIGIGSVIALVSLGQASQKSVENRIQSLGSNLLTIIPGSQEVGGVRQQGSMQTLTLADATALQGSSSVTTVKNVSPEFQSRGQVVAGKYNTNVSVIGVTPAYADVHNESVTSGNFISSRNVDALSKVVVLGPTVVTDIFPNDTNPIGKFVRINGQSFSVIGITEVKGGSGFNNPDNTIYIPLTTAQKIIFGENYLTSIAVSVTDANLTTEAEYQISSILLSRHKISDPINADFRFFSQEDILSTVTQVTGTFTSLLSGIAAISLVVGGIGIMNIMLVTVTERTREIGLRKALGAKKRTITYQFLTEAAAITIIGGFLGIIIGISVSYILTKVISLPFALSVPSIFLAFSVSAIVGLVFGWYPARKASNLQPIEALRYE